MQGVGYCARQSRLELVNCLLNTLEPALGGCGMTDASRFDTIKLGPDGRLLFTILPSIICPRAVDTPQVNTRRREYRCYSPSDEIQPQEQLKTEKVQSPLERSQGAFVAHGLPF